MSSEEYWEERSKLLERELDRRCRITSGEIGKVYEDALSQLEQDISKIFHSYVKGYGLTQAEAQRLLSQKQTRESREKLLAMLEKLEAENADPAAIQALRSVLDAPAYAYRISKLEALRADAYADIATIGLSEVRYQKARLTDLYKESYYRTAFDLSQEVGYNVPFDKLSNRQVAAAVETYWSPGADAVAKNYSSRIWGNTTELAESVSEVMTRGLLTGRTYTDMIEELTRVIGSADYGKKVQPDGTTRTVLTGTGAKYKAARLIRTEGNYISGQARMAAYRDAGIEWYIYRAYLEMRTCQRCGELDGHAFPVSEQHPGFNMHPLHPHCFCFESPFREKDVLERLKRSAQTSPDGWELVPQSMTYAEWREKYVDEEMEEAERERLRRKRRNSTQNTRNPRSSTQVPRAARETATKQREPQHVEPKKWTDVVKEKGLANLPQKVTSK